MKLLVMQLSLPSRHSIPLWSKYSPQHPVLKHSQFKPLHEQLLSHNLTCRYTLEYSEPNRYVWHTPFEAAHSKCDGGGGEGGAHSIDNAAASRTVKGDPAV
jgi:hypothetical protein